MIRLDNRNPTLSSRNSKIGYFEYSVLTMRHKTTLGHSYNSIKMLPQYSSQTVQRLMKRLYCKVWMYLTSNTMTTDFQVFAGCIMQLCWKCSSCTYLAGYECCHPIPQHLITREYTQQPVKRTIKSNIAGWNWRKRKRITIKQTKRKKIFVLLCISIMIVGIFRNRCSKIAEQRTKALSWRQRTYESIRHSFHEW